MWRFATEPRRRALPLLTVLAVGCAVGAPSHAAAPAGIVFASDRDKADPGELYEISPSGGRPVDVSRSPAADLGAVASPTQDMLAYWSTRSGRDRLYLARLDGSHLRVVAGMTGSGSSDRLVFSADGSRLVASTARGPQLALTSYLVDIGSARARPITWRRAAPQRIPGRR